MRQQDRSLAARKVNSGRRGDGVGDGGAGVSGGRAGGWRVCARRLRYLMKSSRVRVFMLTIRSLRRCCGMRWGLQIAEWILRGGASGGVHAWAGADCLTTVPCGRSWGAGVLVPIGGFENADPTPGMGAVDGRGLDIFCTRVLILLAVSVPGSLARPYRIPRKFSAGGGGGGASDDVGGQPPGRRDSTARAETETSAVSTVMVAGTAAKSDPLAVTGATTQSSTRRVC